MSPQISIMVLAGLLPGGAVALPLGALARRLGLVSHPRSDRFSDEAVPVAGGLALVAGLSVPFLVSGGGAPWALRLGALAVPAFGIGLVDDVRELRPHVKAALTLALSLLAPVVMGSSTPGTAVVLAISFWMSLHVFNVIDNMDGVALSTALLSFAGIALVTKSALGWAAAGAAAGVLVWNLPAARVFLGDGGSFLLGAWSWGWGVGAVRAVTRMEGRPEALLLLWALPLLDFCFVTVTRASTRRAPWIGGKDHLSHRIAARTGSVWLALGIWVLVHAVFVAIGVALAGV